MAAELQDPSPGASAGGDPPRHPGARLRLPAGAMPRVTTVATTHATGTAPIGPRRARA